jgi:uncharacterized protein
MISVLCWTATVVAVAAGTAVALSWRRWVGAGRVGAAALAVAAVAMGVVTVGSVAVGGVVGVLDAFGAVRVVYQAAVVALPVTAAAVLVAGRRAVSRPAAVGAVVALLGAPVGVYASLVEPSRLDVDHHTLTLDPVRDGRAPITVAVLTDVQTTHVGTHEHRAVDAVLAARPDLIVVPGDVHQGDHASFERALPGFRELLGRLAAPGGVYAVTGDVDSSGRLQAMARGTAVRVLADEIITTQVGDRTVTIAGLSVSSDPSAPSAVASELESRPGTGDVRILLAHRPDVVLPLPAPARTDIVIAGHTHGGQVSIPFIGPLMTMSRVPRTVAAGGLHDLDGRHILVGRGVGMERGQAPPLRFGVVPNVPVLRLE